MSNEIFAGSLLILGASTLLWIAWYFGNDETPTNEAHNKKLTPEQQGRADLVKQTEASEILEGYPPLSKIGGYPYELQQQWVMGDISSKKRRKLLAHYFGYEYIERKAGRVIDAAETAAKGDFLDIPEFVCRRVED